MIDSIGLISVAVPNADDDAHEMFFKRHPRGEAQTLSIERDSRITNCCCCTEKSCQASLDEEDIRRDARG